MSFRFAVGLAGVRESQRRRPQCSSTFSGAKQLLTNLFKIVAQISAVKRDKEDSMALNAFRLWLVAAVTLKYEYLTHIEYPEGCFQVCGEATEEMQGIDARPHCWFLADKPHKTKVAWSQSPMYNAKLEVVGLAAQSMSVGYGSRTPQIHENLTTYSNM